MPLYPFCLISLLLHAVWFIPTEQAQTRPPVENKRIPIEMVTLSREQPVKLEIEKPEPVVSAVTPEVHKTKVLTSAKPAVTSTWQSSVQKHLQALQKRNMLYPQEAIEQNMQGIAQVLVILDKQGVVVASRVEESSGYTVLDQAALRAVRLLKPLGSDAPEQFVLPVVFKLH